jgi:hypothetical protein
MKPTGSPDERSEIREQCPAIPRMTLALRPGYAHATGGAHDL